MITDRKGILIRLLAVALPALFCVFVRTMQVRADAACTVTFHGDGAEITGQGAAFADGNLIITEDGDYRIFGELNDGSIIVDAPDSESIRLFLHDAHIHAKEDAALRVSEAGYVTIVSEEGTDNVLSSGETFSKEAEDDGRKGTIFARDDLEITGDGKLTVTASCKHAIDVNDSLTVSGGDLLITAPKDAIHVNDVFTFSEAHLVIEAGNDAIRADEKIHVKSGSITVNACYEGLESYAILMEGGDVCIASEDDGCNANGEDADTKIEIRGGTLTVLNADAEDADGLDSNGDILIEGGTVRVSMIGQGTNSALDFGQENGGKMIINGGDVIACGSDAMAVPFSDNSAQCSALVLFRDTVPAGQTIAVCDEAGSELVSYEVPYAYRAVAISHPAFEKGKTYTVSAAGFEEQATFDTVSVYPKDLKTGHGKVPGRPPVFRWIFAIPAVLIFAGALFLLIRFLKKKKSRNQR